MINLVSEGIAGFPDRPTNIAVIQACNLLNAVTPEQREALAAGSFMAYAGRGEFIFMRGSPSEFVTVVGAGFVKMTKTTATGQEVALDLLGPGQVVGLLAVIEGRPFPLTAVAVTNCWYLKIPTCLFMPTYDSSNALKDLVVRHIGPRLRKAHDMMLRMSSGRVEERIAVVLFLLSDSYGEQTPKGVRLTVPLTRQDIAEMAGTTVETAIRTLSRWQKEGIIGTTSQRITILKEEMLQVIMHGCV